MTGDIKAFEARVPELRVILSKRKGSWTLTTVDWEDIESILLARLWQKFHLYRPDKGPLENWANTVISRALSNLLRDSLMKWSKPCTSAGPYGGTCVFNQMGDGCSYTQSGIKCGQCKLYRRWQEKKESLYNIKASLPLEHHDMEVQNMQEDFLDIAAAKLKIDACVMSQLNSHDAKVYRLLFIDHLSMEEVSKRMKYKTQSNSKVGQVLRKLVARFKELARAAIESEDIS